MRLLIFQYLASILILNNLNKPVFAIHGQINVHRSDISTDIFYKTQISCCLYSTNNNTVNTFYRLCCRWTTEPHTELS